MTLSSTLRTNDQRAVVSQFDAGFLVLKRVIGLVVLMVITVGITPASGLAQSNVTGSLSGRADEGSVVKAVNLDTGFSLTTTASSSGRFSVLSMPPGPYRVSLFGETGELISSKVIAVRLQVDSWIDFSSEDDDVIQLDTYRVAGGTISAIDFNNTQARAVYHAEVLNDLPMSRSTGAVALLAPGTVSGDSDLGEGELVSFGGASVAENAYYVNGFNLSDFRRGIDPAEIPYEAYDQFTIMTGGYSAEYGRSLGGVITGTTKSGTNEFHAGVKVYYAPDFARETEPDVSYRNNSGRLDVWEYNSADYRNALEANFSFSGPLIKDRLFYYGLYVARDQKTEDVTNSGATLRKTETSDPLYLLKLDATPFPNNRLEYTYIKNQSVTEGAETDYDFGAKTDAGTGLITDKTETGGDIHIARYTGTFFERLTLSALYGMGTQNQTAVSSRDLEPLVYDIRNGAFVQLAGTSNLSGEVSTGEDKREAMRFDVTYQFSLWGEHQLRAGLDREQNRSVDNTTYSGGVFWLYASTVPGTSLAGGTVPPGVTQWARAYDYQSIGSFQVISEAYYIEDNWALMDGRLRLRLGFRNEAFENLNKNDETFVKIDRQFAPRFGASFDLSGDQKTRLYANFGRYHIPVASNTNVRLSGGELFTQTYYVLNAVNADGTPDLGAQIGSQATFSDGSIPDRDTIVARNLQPMYQDEIQVGLDHAVGDAYRVGARFTHRELGSAIDDMITDHALTAYARANGYPNADYSGYYHYVLGNPGSDLQTAFDFDGDGVNETITLTAAQLGYQTAKRDYAAVELFFEKIWDGKWFAQFSYTWSQSYGNTEGWVLSDNAQDEPGTTLLFDTPQLGVGADGYLPNDRRHSFKVYGSYALSQEWQLGYHFSYTSGRPFNRMGWFNDPVVGTDYEAAYFLLPRGSAGRLGWVFQNNLSFHYRPKWGGGRLTFSLDVFNVLNLQTATERVESYSTDLAGSPDVTYGLRTAGQAPRSIRIGAGYEY